jgi:hypothetical protein
MTHCFPSGRPGTESQVGKETLMAFFDSAMLDQPFELSENTYMFLTEWLS